MTAKTNSPNTPNVLRFTPHLALFLCLFAVYLLTYTPRVNSSDGIAMFATAENLVRRGALDIEQIRWMGLQQGTFGLDGLLYSRKGVGLPLGMLPLVWLGLASPWFGPVSAGLLFNAVITALSGVLLLVYIELLGFSRRSGLIVALTFGLTTLAWTYAKSLFSDPFSGFLLLAAALLLLKFKHRVDSTPVRAHLILFYPFLAGLLLGWNVATRYAEVLFVAVFGLLLLYYLRHTFNNLRVTFYTLAAFVAPLIFIGLSLLAFNISRYGDPFNTGYLPNETFSGVLWQGVLGQLLSPGRGLLLFSPILIMSFFGLMPALRQFRAEAILAFSIILIHLLLYGKWFMWHGGFAWGPRFLIPTLPFWAILLAPLAARAFPNNIEFNSQSGYTKPIPGTYLLRLAYLTLAVLSVVPLILTTLLDFSPFQGFLLDTGLPMFDPQTFFKWQYSPLVQGWSQFSPTSLDVVWAWQGEYNWLLLSVLGINLVVTGVHLFQSLNSTNSLNQRISESANSLNQRISESANYSKPAHHALRTTLPLLTTFIAVFALLMAAHQLVDEPLRAAVGTLNQGVNPSDAIILNDPEITLDFAELYTGRAPVLGFNNGGYPLPNDVLRRLDETKAHHPQIWWLPNWLPPEQSAIEQTLLAAGFRARNDSFDRRRLSLFAFPQGLTAQEVNATFGHNLVLLQASYPDPVAAGTALPVELRWQALTAVPANYHVFIHLVTANGSTVAQADGQPALWTRPTSTWQPGETITDRHGLWLPATIVPGDYELRIGLYRSETGERLRLPDENDAFSVKVVVDNQ